VLLFFGDVFPHRVHHLADLGQASASGGVFLRAPASSLFLRGDNVFQDQRTAVFQDIPAQIFFGVIETTTYRAGHEDSPRVLRRPKDFRAK
jgi:hypothetical protein